jgi:hypothetical protein
MSDQSGHEQNQGDLAQEILDKILSDPDFRQQLLDNPAETLKQAGYVEGDDVSGYMLMHKMGRVYRLENPSRHVYAVDPAPTPPTTAMDCGGGGTATGPKPKPKPGSTTSDASGKYS